MKEIDSLPVRCSNVQKSSAAKSSTILGWAGAHPFFVDFEQRLTTYLFTFANLDLVGGRAVVLP